MPALQVREFPAELYGELRERAAAENRSIAQQTIVAVREYLHPVGRVAAAQSEYAETEDSRVERRRQFFEQLDAFPPVVIPDDFPSPAEIVRQIRDER